MKKNKGKNKRERKKEEERRKKRERRKKKEVEGRARVSPRQISLGLAGDPRFVLFCFCFFFFRPWVCETHSLFVCLFVFFFFFFFSGRGSRSLTSPSSLAVALPRHLAATHLAKSRRPATETHGWVSPVVGLVFSWF
jgi:hypothetical protein